ncbi:cysteine-rich venom protein Mr30-like [Babylonia areolata]|uniref:cysteine-rich venom protein Mr30-like n=1 Tax=Babylonia areolata TaxID=304850 RepID=UPI003FCFECC7
MAGPVKSQFPQKEVVLSTWLWFTWGIPHTGSFSTCPEKYANYTVTHTMCFTDHESAQAVAFTQAEKDELVRLHNSARRNVTDASNMLKVKWDDRLATVAEKWAMNCTQGHDANRAEPDLPGKVGQNFAEFPASSSHLVGFKLWYDELQHYEFDNWSGDNGHYVQVIFSKTRLIGCGQAICDDRKHFVCNYYVASMSTGHYKQGTQCGDCGSSCQNNLCDCTTGVDGCFNGGTYNINTCTCDCPPLWTGNDCTTTIKANQKQSGPGPSESCLQQI